MTVHTHDQLTPSEALALLDLQAIPAAPLPDALTLRKAYVRAIKRYSPESNPQEFQRVRSAYELLEERRRWADYDRDVDDRDDDVADEPPAGNHDAAAPPERPTDERSERGHPPAPTGGSDEPALPPWHATQDELTAILTTAGVMQDGVRPQVSISDASRERITWLVWRGWPERLDQPLVRFAARLFELGHTYEGHLLLERLLSATEHPQVARDVLPDSFRARLAGISREVRDRGESAQLGWVFGPDHVDAVQPRVEESSTDWKKVVFALVWVVIIALRVGAKCTTVTSSSGNTPSPPVYANWVNETCRDAPSVCGIARDLDRAIDSGNCGHIKVEVEGFVTAVNERLPNDQAHPIALRAFRYARRSCSGGLGPEPRPVSSDPP